MIGIPLFDQGDERAALRKRCRAAGISIDLIEELIEAEIEQIGKLRKRGLKDKFDQILDGAAEPKD